jgi:hypothetical protein
VVLAGIELAAALAANPPAPVSQAPEPDRSGWRAALPVPPADSPAPTGSRRRALLSGTAALLAVAATGGAWALTRQPSDGVLRPFLAAPSVSPSKSATHRTLTFDCDATPPSGTVTYALNGKQTVLHDVVFPWHRDIEIPPLPEASTFQIRLDYPTNGSSSASVSAHIDGRSVGGWSGNLNGMTLSRTV